MMRLGEFIARNPEPILMEFEAFARTHTRAGEGMEIEGLRDHAAAMLAAMATDMGHVQSEAEQRRKSKGDTPPPAGEAPTAAEQHGTDRAVSGFTLREMFAEYRALRASVLRLWTASGSRRLDEQDVLDLIRFNEAIDQALAESITRFSIGLDRSREIFLAILGHDLRAPLGAVTAATGFLVDEGDLTGANLTMASRARSSADRMAGLVADLIDFASAHHGAGMPVSRHPVDFAEIGRDIVEELAEQHPNRTLDLQVEGDTRGRWDPRRVSQALANLIGNAIQHGDNDGPVTISIHGFDAEVVADVHNAGSPISIADQRVIFEPFKRAERKDGSTHERWSMGLGLYIAREVAAAHGGRIELHSDADQGTTFSLHLPRGG